MIIIMMMRIIIAVVIIINNNDNKNNNYFKIAIISLQHKTITQISNITIRINTNLTWLQVLELHATIFWQAVLPQVLLSSPMPNTLLAVDTIWMMRTPLLATVVVRMHCPTRLLKSMLTIAASVWGADSALDVVNVGA